MTKARDPGRFSNSCLAKSTEITSVFSVFGMGGVGTIHPPENSRIDTQNDGNPYKWVHPPENSRIDTQNDVGL